MFFYFEMSLSFLCFQTSQFITVNIMAMFITILTIYRNMLSILNLNPRIVSLSVISSDPKIVSFKDTLYILLLFSSMKKNDGIDTKIKVCFHLYCQSESFNFLWKLHKVITVWNKRRNEPKTIVYADCEQIKSYVKMEKDRRSASNHSPSHFTADERIGRKKEHRLFV